MIIPALLMGGGMAMDIFGRLEEGKEAKKRAYWEAQERLHEKAQLRSEESTRQAIRTEQAHEVAREKSYARGAARARIASAGVKATGSAGTLLDSITAAYMRKMKGIELQTSAETISYEGKSRALSREYHELIRMGKRAKKASRWGAGGSLLSGGYQFGKSMEWWGA